jgi:hypothetical protein
MLRAHQLRHGIVIALALVLGASGAAQPRGVHRVRLSR